MRLTGGIRPDESAHRPGYHQNRKASNTTRVWWLSTVMWPQGADVSTGFSPWEASSFVFMSHLDAEHCHLQCITHTEGPLKREESIQLLRCTPQLHHFPIWKYINLEMLILDKFIDIEGTPSRNEMSWAPGREVNYSRAFVSLFIAFGIHAQSSKSM